MSYRVSFDSCWAKLDRAKAHRDQLWTYYTETFTVPAKRPSLRAELDRETGYHVFRIDAIPDFKPFVIEVGLRIGDVIHNVRSSLDHLTWQLANSFTDGAVVNDTRVQFPIVTDRYDDAGRDLWKAARKRNLSEVDAIHAAQIEGYQPYKGVNGRPDSWSGEYIHQLALLQDLSNKDKHRLLTPVLLLPTFSAFEAPEGGEFAQRDLGDVALERGLSDAERFRGHMVDDIPLQTAGELVEIGTEIIRARFIGSDLPDEMEMAGYVIPEIALSEGSSAFSALDRIAAFATLILREFEPLF